MQVAWFTDIKDKDKQEEFKKSVVGSKIVLDKAKLICYNKIRVGERSKLTDYDSPSWAYRQADLLGYNRALNEIMELLTVADE